MSTDLATTLQELLGAGPMRATQLALLSDVPTSELQGSASLWLQAAPSRRRALLAELRSLAEDNIEYTFKNVFLFALGDPDPDVRRAAVDGLWEEESPSVLERLQVILRADASAEVRTAAATALTRFAYRGAVGDMSSSRAEQLQEVLRRSLLEAPDGGDLQLRLLEALAYFEDEPVVREYIARLYREGDEDEQAAALLSMGRTLDPRWGATVREELDNQSAILRFHAARAAGDLGLTEAVPSLSRMAEDEEEDPEVRGNAVWALGQIGTQPALSVLRGVASGGSEELREAAEEALGEAVYAENDA
ncbi:MAG: HEAT repeat domain-containing protein [Chloroflexota bacterium]|nr:HEAT repeat domain-containing protein [Chloroflexota bacterium]